MGKCPDPKPRRWRALIFFIVGCMWGISCSPRGGGMGSFCWRWVHSLVSFCLFCSYMAFYSPLYSYSCILFYLSGAGPAEKGWFPVGGGLQIGDRGPEPGDRGMGKKRKQWWQVQRQRVSMGFLGEQCYISPYPQPHPLTRKSAIPHLPPSPICPLKSPQDLKFLILQTRQ